MEGCKPTAEACAELGMDFIPGVELTAEFKNYEVHLLGYLMKIEDTPLASEIVQFQRARQERIREMVRRLNHLGISLDAETVFEIANCRCPGRPHVARALVKKGLCSSVDEAFSRFLRRRCPAWAPKFRISAHRSIELIKQAGGVVVLAHPGLSRAAHLIPELINAGIDGLECFHSKHSTTETEHYVNTAKQHELIITGGSDCHGTSKGKPLIGSIKLPSSYVHKLRAKAAQFHPDTPPIPAMNLPN